MCVHQGKMVCDLSITASWENRLKTLSLSRRSASASRKVPSSGPLPQAPKVPVFLKFAKQNPNVVVRDLRVVLLPKGISKCLVQSFKAPFFAWCLSCSIILKWWILGKRKWWGPTLLSPHTHTANHVRYLLGNGLQLQHAVFQPLNEAVWIKCLCL